VSLTQHDREFIARFASQLATEKHLTAADVQASRCVLFNPSDSALVTTDADPDCVEEHKRRGFYLIGGFLLYKRDGFKRMAPINAFGARTSATETQTIAYLIATAAISYSSGSSVALMSSEEIEKFDPSATHILMLRKHPNAIWRQWVKETHSD